MKPFAWLPTTLYVLCLCCLAALVPAPIASGHVDTGEGTSGSAGQQIHIGENFPIDGVHSDCRVYGKPAIAFDGQNFLVAWQDGSAATSAPSSNVYASRITPDGEVLDPGGIPVSVSSSLHCGPASVSFDGQNYMLVWDCTADSGADDSTWELFCARVTPSGQVLAPGVQQLTTGSDCWGNRPVGISFDGSDFLVVYRTKSSLIRGLRVSTSGTSLDGPTGFTISDNGKYPSVAFDGTNYFVVWHTPGLDYRGARVATDGTVLDPDGITICSSPDNQEHGTVAYGGGCYLVVWEEWSSDRLRGKVRGARVSVDGTVLDTTPLNIGERCRGENAVMVSSDGNDFLVTWMTETQREDGGADPDFRLIDSWGRRVSPDGSFVDQVPFPISTSRWHAFGPLAGYGAGRYLVAWRDQRLDSPSIWGQMLDADATPWPAPAAPVTPAGSSTVWTSESSPTNEPLYAIAAFDAERAMAFGELSGAGMQGNLVRDPLGWSMGSCEPWTVYGAFALSGDDVWTSGWNEAVHHYHGSAWSTGGGGSSGPSPIGTGIWGTDDEHLWFSGSGGTVRVGAGMDGLPGEFQNVGTTADLHDVWGFAWDDIYTVGDLGLVFHFDGQTWSRVPDIPTWQTLNAVWGNGPHDIFAIGDFGTILHYDGTQWALQYSGTTQDLQGLWGRNGSDVYAVGFGGTILHYDGVSWTPESSGVADDLMTVAGAPDQDGTMSVWIGGSAGRILHTRYAVANQAPVGVPDDYSTAQDQELVVPPPGVLANDLDADGDPLHVELVSDVAHGQLDLLPTGWFTYRPAAGWSGSDGFTYRVTDGFSSSEVTTVSILVTPPPDTTPPTTTDDAPVAWCNSAVTVTLTATDNGGSGVKSITYAVDSDGPTTVDAAATSVVVSGEGTHTITFHAIDNAGNPETDKSCTVKIDTTSPTTTAAGADADWHNGAVPVTLTATDNVGGSGVQSITCAVDGGAPTTVDAAMTQVIIDAPADHGNDGIHTITFHAIDNAGNPETPDNSCTVRIDTSKPTTRAPRKATVTRGRHVKLRYRVNDLAPNGGAAAVTIEVKTLTGKVVKTLDLGVKPVNKFLSTKFRCTLAKRTYKFFVYATDTAGNTQAKAGSNKLVVR